jgi:hypothetical protein
MQGGVLTEERDEVGEELGGVEIPLSARQLHAFQYGLGARIMPAHDGWKVDFFSVPDFEQEPGTTFATLQEAVQLVLEWLPRVNSEEERAKAKALEELLRLRLERTMDTTQE